mgnify:CR=1 FL=1
MPKPISEFLDNATFLTPPTITTTTTIMRNEMTEKEWIHKGRKYYANKEDAIKRKQKGDRVYYDAHLKAYYIVKPRRKKILEG